MLDSISLPPKTFDRYLAHLSGAEFKVYMALLREKDKSTGKKTRLTRKELAFRTGLSGRYIKVVLQGLESRGMVRVETSEMGVMLYAELRESARPYF